MDWAYQGDNVRLLAQILAYEPIVPTKSNRLHKWNFDKELYKLRNEIERFFRRLKRFRRIFTRYDKLDIVYSVFILFTMFVDSVVWTRPRAIYKKKQIGMMFTKNVANKMLNNQSRNCLLNTYAKIAKKTKWTV